MVNEQDPSTILLGQYAGFVTRLIAWGIDQLIVSGILTLLGIVITWLLNTLGLNEWLQTEGWIQLIVVFLLLGLVLVIPLLYRVGFWVLAGQTPGKRGMGVRIERTDGDRVKWGNAIRRQIGYWISSILFLGYFWILIDNRRQGWHDKLAGTLVVYAWPEKEGSPVEDRLRRIRERRMASHSDS